MPTLTWSLFVIVMERTHEQSVSTRSLCYGALAWIAFSIIVVVVRGVRWEETYEHALIITGIAPYPEGHPCFQYCRNVFSGQSYLSALLLHLIDSPLLINGYRNVLQLVFCTVPVFLLGARFSGRATYGHIAVVLVLLGIHRDLQSYYPIESWPHMYAIGQIGTGYALLVLALLLYGYWRTVWLLLGLMVAIHVGQLPVIGAVAGAQWLLYLFQGNRRRVAEAVGYFVLGLVPAMLLFAAVTKLHVPLPAEGAYAATGDMHAIWAAYTERYDLHRGFARLNPFWKSWVGVALLLLLAGLQAGMKHRRSIWAQDYTWVGVYGLILSVVVGGIWLIHQVMGGDIPFLLLGWMPYRLTNHLAILLVPLALGVLLRTEKDETAQPWWDAGQAFVALLLAQAILLPLWAIVLPESIYARYVGNLDSLLWLLSGGALLAVLRPGFRAAPKVHTLLLGAGAITLVLLSPFALAALLGGGALYALLMWAGANLLKFRLPNASLLGLTAMLLVSLLIQQGQKREHLPVHPMQQEVIDYLAARGESDAMLVPPYWDVAWLAKTRHPIFADYQTAHHMTYIRPLAPGLKKMHAEVYGFPVDSDGGVPLAPWPTRSAAAWHALAEGYGFDYILAPSEMELTLKPVLKSHPYALYRVLP